MIEKEKKREGRTRNKEEQGRDEKRDDLTKVNPQVIRVIKAYLKSQWTRGVNVQQKETTLASGSEVICED